MQNNMILGKSRKQQAHEDMLDWQSSYQRPVKDYTAVI